MFVVVAVPVVDVRGMVAGDSGRVTVPFWPDPAYGNEFVRGLGALRPRPRRGVAPWLGESYFVDAGPGVRFFEDGSGVGRSGSLAPVYRRYYSDGVVGRLEVAFRSPPPPSGLGPSSVAAVMAAAALTKVRRPGAGAGALIGFGDELARCLLESTTSVRRRPHEVPDWWVTPGAPVVVAEVPAGEFRDRSAPGWEPAALGRPFDAEAVLVRQRWQNIAGSRISTWSLEGDDAAAAAPLHKLRTHVVRSHSELEAFRSVLRLCQRGRLDATTSGPVRDFIQDRSKFLLRRTFDRLPQRELLQQVLDTIDDGYADELLAIETLSARLNRGLAGKLDDLGTLFQGAQASGPNQVFVVEPGGTLTMTDNSIDVSGNVGNVQGGSGNIQSVGDVSQTVNDGADLTALVAELVKAVGSLRGQVPDEVVVEGEDAASALQDEVAKEAPDPGKVSRWLDRLKDWAERAGEVAAPVLTVIGAAVKILA